MAPRLDGPRLPPKSGTTRSLVIFIHGYGADGNDLIDIGRAWADLLPDTTFVSPHAPERHPGGFGRQWFELTFRDPHERERGVAQARPTLDAFIDAERDAAGLADDRVALVGFSQGTMMSLHVGLRRPKPLAAIVGYSGLLAAADKVAEEAVSRPPILLVHGDMDEVIPVQALAQARNALGAAGLAVEWHVSRGIGHGIDGDGLRIGGQFLARSLGAIKA